MKFYAIVCVGKEVSTLRGRAGQTLVFAGPRDAQEAIRMECLDEVYVSVKIIAIGEEIICQPDTRQS